MTSASVLPHLSDVATRWVGAGASDVDDATEAGRLAARQAITGSDVKLVVVFASDRHDLARLLAGVRDVAGAAPVVGCTTAGELSGVRAGDLGVAVMAFGGPGFSVGTRVVTDASRDPRGAGTRVAAALDDVPPTGHRLMLLLVDGVVGDGQDVVRGVYDAVGAGVPLVGGASADSLRMQGAHQFHGSGTAPDGIFSDAVVAVALRSDGPFGIGVDHGWRHVGDPVLVTAGTGRVVHTLNDEPALDAYLRHLGAPAEAWHDDEAFRGFAFTRPLGLVRRGSTVVRLVAGADFTTRSLICGTEVPSGRLVWFMEGDSASVLGATDVACSQAIEALDGASPLGLLVFDCAARRSVLGPDGLDREIAGIARHAPQAAVTGFYTLGEIARTRGTSGYHNKTLVVLALG